MTPLVTSHDYVTSIQQERLSQARESLKDFQRAAQGAVGFLHNAEASFLSAPGGVLDCTDEQRQTQQGLEAFEDGFQAHICKLGERVLEQPCLSRPETELLHVSVLSQLLVGGAALKAQAQLRLESLQRYWALLCNVLSDYVVTSVYFLVYEKNE